MPLQVAIQLPGKSTPLTKTIILKEKLNSYTIATDTEPLALILDPGTWVLMDAEFKRKSL